MSECQLVETCTKGVIRMEIDGVSNFLGPKFSHILKIGNVPWKSSARLITCSKTSDTFLGIYVHCNPTTCSNLWTCSAYVEIQIIKSNGEVFSKSLEKYEFSKQRDNRGYGTFMKRADWLDPANGYVTADRSIVEAHITIVSVSGMRKRKIYDFSKCSNDASDAKLIVENQTIFVDRFLLARFSTYFRAVFHTKTENSGFYIVDNVKFEEMNDFLNVIYGSLFIVTAENVESLLKLAVRFDSSIVTEKCEQFLIKCDVVPMAQKLVMAEEFRLSELQDSCLRSFKTLSAVKMAIPKPSCLGAETAIALLERIYSFQK